MKKIQKKKNIHESIKKRRERKEEERKNILREIVSNAELDSISRKDLFYKIKNNEIMTEYRLEIEIIKKRIEMEKHMEKKKRKNPKNGTVVSSESYRKFNNVKTGIKGKWGW